MTSIHSHEQILIRHIMDSIVVNPHLCGDCFIDVGTGPGLPGVPLAIVRPEAHFTLLDSLGKRIRFLRQVQHELELNNVTTVQSQVESFTLSSGFDGVISRAFASLGAMLTWCAALPTKEKGRFYALKGRLSEMELTDLPLGFRLESVIRLQVPGLESERHIVVVSMMAN